MGTSRYLTAVSIDAHWVELSWSHAACSCSCCTQLSCSMLSHFLALTATLMPSDTQKCLWCFGHMFWVFFLVHWASWCHDELQQLKINTDKTQLIWLIARQELDKLTTTGLALDVLQGQHHLTCCCRQSALFSLIGIIASLSWSCQLQLYQLQPVWHGGAMVRHLGLRSVGRGFKSCLRQCCVTTLGKLFTPMCLCHQAVKLGTGQRAVMLCGWGGNCRPGGK